MKTLLPHVFTCILLYIKRKACKKNNWKNEEKNIFLPFLLNKALDIIAIR